MYIYKMITILYKDEQFIRKLIKIFPGLVHD